jgi:hypothetical protein
MEIVFSNIWSSAFENSPSIPSFLVTKIAYIGYGQLKKWLFFLKYGSTADMFLFSQAILLSNFQLLTVSDLTVTMYIDTTSNLFYLFDSINVILMGSTSFLHIGLTVSLFLFLSFEWGLLDVKRVGKSIGVSNHYNHDNSLFGKCL